MLAYDRSSTGLWVALIFLVSLNLRPAIAAVGPVLAQMGTDLAWGEGVQGVLTAIPLIAFAAVSPRPRSQVSRLVCGGASEASTRAPLTVR